MSEDLHRKKAAEIFKVPESQVTPEQRRFAKSANFPGLYSNSQTIGAAMSQANIHPETGVAYGYISGHSLDPDLLQILQDNGTDIHYKDARNAAEMEAEAKKELAETAWIENGREGTFDPDCELDFNEDEFNDSYQDSEPVHAGTYLGVQYQTSWLGGALNVWIFQSPHITKQARRASPCVPNAGILDVLDGDVEAYNVPDDWRLTEA